MAEEKLKSIKSLIRAVLMSSKDGVATSRLLADYSEFAGEYLPYKEMGYTSIVKFIESIPDVARIRMDHKTGEERVIAIADESTAHIQKMVSKQRSVKKRKKALPRGMHRRPTRPVVPGRPPLGSGPRPPPRGPYGGLPYRGPPRGPPYRGRPNYPPSYGASFSSYTNPRPRPRPLMETDGTQIPPTVYGGIWDTNNNRDPPKESFKNMSVTVGSSAETRSGSFSRKVAEKSEDDRRRNPSAGSEKKFGQNFEVPPRFQKKEDTSNKPVAVVSPNLADSENWDSPEKTPNAAHYPDFPSDPESCEYLELLEEYIEHHPDAEVSVDSIEDKLGPVVGYKGIVTFNGRSFNTDGIFETKIAAREQAAKNTCEQLNITKENVRNRGVPTGMQVGSITAPESVTPAQNTTSAMPADIKKNVIKILESVTERGIWGKRLVVLYTEQFGPPPDDLIDLIKQSTDIAKVEEQFGRFLIYPVKQESTPSEPVHQPAIAAQNQNNPEASKQAVDTREVKIVTPTASKPLQSYSARTKLNMKNLVTPTVNLFKDSVIPPPPTMAIGADNLVYVSYATSVTEFCIQLDSSCCDEINEVLQTVCKNLPKPDPRFIEKDIYCSALYSQDDQWYRARVVSDITDKKLSVRFVDYGNIETVSIDNIRQLPPTVVNLPEQAIVCSLYGIKPPHGDKQWSKESLNIFAEFVRDQALIAFPVMVQDDIYDVHLYRHDDKDKSLNQILIEKGEAVALSSLPKRSPNEPEILEIPDDMFLDVYVSFLSPITGVMVRIVGEQYSDKLEELESELESFYKISPFNHVIEAGMICVVCLESLYHRVKVLSIEGDQAECYFLDHGDSELIKKEILKPIDVNLNKKLPYQGISVELYGLENLLDTTTFEQLYKLAVAKICVAEVISREEKLTVVLYDTEGEEDLNINEFIAKILISEGKPIDLNLFSTNVGPSSLSDTLSVGSNDSGSTSKADIPKNIVTPFEPKQQLSAEDVINSMQANFNSMSLSKNTADISVPSGKLSNSAASSTSSIYTWNKAPHERTSTPTNEHAALTKPPSVISSLSNESTSTVMPPYVEIPAIGEIFPIFVMWAVDPTNFVCVPHDMIEKLEKFMMELNDYYQRAVLEDVEPEVGQLYAGTYNEAWYRVIVKDIIGEELNVYMADYGEYTITTADHLQPLPRKFCELPFTAFKGKLHGLTSSGDHWSEASKYTFITATRGRSLFALVCEKDEVERVVSLRLIDTSDENEDVCIDEVLINMNLARRQ